MSVSSFAPFSLDDPERIGCQECLLSDPALVGCKSDRYYVLRSTAAPQSVALRARHCSGVDSGDMLVSPWVLDCLHLTPGGSIDVSLFNNGA